MLGTTTLPFINSVISAAHQSQQKEKVPENSHQTKLIPKRAVFGARRKEPQWQCATSCGACCKLAKAPAFATPEEIFTDPSDIELYRSLVGPDGWCIHYEKSTRTCSIYPDRPYFCRVEPQIFHSLYGIDKKKFNKEACSSCRDTIKAVYGSNSKELDNFNQNIKKCAAS